MWCQLNHVVNVPLRDYQLAITKTALFSNTLVALPTGLGKTLIAAVVMYNYFRWFPEGKGKLLLSCWVLKLYHINGMSISLIEHSFSKV